ncbi:MAG: glutathione S-transferase C-terminal domain-containing protein [Cyanobacteria bacterium P01_H01_bin.121]
MAKSVSLPAGFLIEAAQFGWRSLWRLMMSQLAPSSATGAYQRPQSQFRHIPAEPFVPTTESGQPRYGLIVGMSCPWAHRTLVVRSLKGLESCLPVVQVVPSPKAGGWIFTEPFLECQTLRQFYERAQTGYQGRATVPILWDQVETNIINNESADIIKILNTHFNTHASQADLDLYPTEVQAEIDTWNEKIYHAINDGVYRCGFAQTQAAYEVACQELFDLLSQIDRHLANHRYLCGQHITLADVRLFTTLIRFDVAYYGLFKCNRRRIQDYEQLRGYLRDLYQLSGIAVTCDFQQIKADYYGNLFPLNPGGLIPVGPDLADLNQPHDRAIH